MEAEWGVASGVLLDLPPPVDEYLREPEISSNA